MKKDTNTETIKTHKIITKPAKHPFGIRLWKHKRQGTWRYSKYKATKNYSPYNIYIVDEENIPIASTAIDSYLDIGDYLVENFVENPIKEIKVPYEDKYIDEEYLECYSGPKSIDNQIFFDTIEEDNKLIEGLIKHLAIK